MAKGCVELPSYCFFTLLHTALHRSTIKWEESQKTFISAAELQTLEKQLAKQGSISRTSMHSMQGHEM